eukprot:5482_1
MFCIDIIIIQWQLITGTIDYFVSDAVIDSIYLDDHMIFIYIFVSLLPTVLISKWKELTFVGMISALSVVALIGTLIIVCISASYLFPGGQVPSQYFKDTSFDTKNAAQHAMNTMDRSQRMFFAFLIFKSGMDANCAIPQLVLSLKNKS